MERNRQEDETSLKINSNLNSELGKQLEFGLGQTARKWIQDFLKQLSERLEKMEEVLVVDRIEGNIAVCENRKSGKMQNVSLSNLPQNIQEGSILKWKDGKYEIDSSKEIEQRIKQKMKDVWN